MRRLGSLGQVEQFVVADQARRVLAVREDHDRLPADVLFGRRADLLQFLERDVDRLVERRRAARHRLADGALERAPGRCVKGWSTSTRSAKPISWPRSCGREAAREADRRLLGGRHLVLHARARVEQQRQRDRHVRPVEVGDVLLRAVLEDVELFGRQVGHVAARRRR